MYLGPTPIIPELWYLALRLFIYEAERSLSRKHVGLLI
jgi:hypothetical protein